MKTHAVLLALVALTASLLHAQSPADPIGGNLFPPDFIMANAEAIGLTAGQQQALRAAADSKQDSFRDLQQALNQEVDALGKLLAEPAPEETAVLAQFDKVQDRERDIKRAQLVLMLGLRSKLTAEQRTKLAELRVRNSGQQRSPEYVAKMERVVADVTRWQREGRDPSPVRKMIQQAQTLMQSGKSAEASAALDEVIKKLEGGK